MPSLISILDEIKRTWAQIRALERPCRSFTERPARELLPNSGFIIPNVHFPKSYGSREEEREQRGKRRKVTVQICHCYCGAEVQTSNLAKHMNLNAAAIPAPDGCVDLDGLDLPDPLRRILMQGKPQHHSLPTRTKNEALLSFLSECSLGAVLGRIFFLAQFYQRRLAPQFFDGFRFPLRISGDRSGDRMTQKNIQDIRNAESREESWRINCLNRLTMGEGVRSRPAPRMRTYDEEVAGLVSTLSLKNALTTAINPSRSRTVDEEGVCVTPAGARDLARDYQALTRTPRVLEALSLKPDQLYSRLTEQHYIGGFRAKELTIDFADENHSFSDLELREFDLAVNTSAMGDGPIRCLLWVLGVPYSKKSPVAPPRLNGHFLEILNILRTLDCGLGMAALGQLFIVCEANKLISAISSRQFREYQPHNPLLGQVGAEDDPPEQMGSEQLESIVRKYFTGP